MEHRPLKLARPGMYCRWCGRWVRGCRHMTIAEVKDWMPRGFVMREVEF